MVYDGQGYLSYILTGWAQIYEEEFREYWGLDSTKSPEGLDKESWESIKLWDTVAMKLLDSARKLHKDEDLSPEITVELLVSIFDSQEDIKEFIEQRIELEFAKEFEDHLLAMTRRAVKLLRFLMKVNGEVTRSYLRRVSDCYVRGLVVETVIMCGAVLEAALEGACDDQLVREEFGLDKEFVPISKRIEFLRRRGVISSHQAKKAWAISKARNDAVHLRLETVSPDSLQMIQDLADVVGAISIPEWE